MWALKWVVCIRKMERLLSPRAGQQGPRWEYKETCGQYTCAPHLREREMRSQGAGITGEMPRAF